MKLINADELKVNFDQKFSFGLENKIKLFDEIDNTEEFDLEEHDKQVVDVFKKKMKGYLRRHKTTGISDYDIDCIAEYSLKDIYEDFLENCIKKEKDMEEDYDK